MNTFLNLVYRIVKGSPLTPSEHDENLDKISENAETVNSRLGVALKADGTLKDDSVGTDAVQAEAITPAKVPDNSIPLVKLFYEEDEGTPVRMFTADEEGRKRFADKFVNLRMIADEVKGLLSDELLLINYETDAGENGQLFNAGNWERAPLTTIKTNEIGASATLVGDQVTLPAGKWRISIFVTNLRRASGDNASDYKPRLRRISPGGEQTLIVGPTATQKVGGTSQRVWCGQSLMTGQVELAEPTLLELQIFGRTDVRFEVDSDMANSQEKEVYVTASFRRLGGEPS